MPKGVDLVLTRIQTLMEEVVFALGPDSPGATLHITLDFTPTDETAMTIEMEALLVEREEADDATE